MKVINLIILGWISNVLCISPWDKYNLSPMQRDITPQISSFNDTTAIIVYPIRLTENKRLVIDFEKEVGGIISLNTSSSCDSHSMEITFSESIIYIATSGLNIITRREAEEMKRFLHIIDIYEYLNFILFNFSIIIIINSHYITITR